MAGGVGAKDGGCRGEPKPDSGQGAARATAPSRGSVCGPTLLPALLLTANGRTINPRGPVREGRGGEGKEKRDGGMGVLWLWEAEWLPAGSYIPRLLGEGFA